MEEEAVDEPVHETVQKHASSSFLCADARDELHDVTAAGAGRVNALEVETDFVTNRKTWKEIQIQSEYPIKPKITYNCLFQYW